MRDDTIINIADTEQIQKSDVRTQTQYKVCNIILRCVAFNTYTFFF